MSVDDIKDREIYRLNGVVRSLTESLDHWRKQFDAEYAEVLRLNLEMSLESRVAAWVCSRIGPEYMASKERAMRCLEEAVELAQAEGISWQQTVRQVFYVLDRPSGAPMQEAGGLAVCLLGWCAANGVKLSDISRDEILRIEAKPLDSIRGSVSRKSDQGLVTCVDLPESPTLDSKALDSTVK